MILNCIRVLLSSPFCCLSTSFSVFRSFLFLSLSLTHLSWSCQKFLRYDRTIRVSSLWEGDRHDPHLHHGSCYEPPHYRHGLLIIIRDIQKPVISPHFKGLNSFQFCCQVQPSLTYRKVDKMFVRISLALEAMRCSCPPYRFQSRECGCCLGNHVKCLRFHQDNMSV